MQDRVQSPTEPARFTQGGEMEDRVKALSRISGLWVTTHREPPRDRAFIFGPLDGPLKQVYTYRKAKVFAEGVALGRELAGGII